MGASLCGGPASGSAASGEELMFGITAAQEKEINDALATFPEDVRSKLIELWEAASKDAGWNEMRPAVPDKWDDDKKKKEADKWAKLSDIEKAVIVITARAETGAQKLAAAQLLGLSEAKSSADLQKETEEAIEEAKKVKRSEAEIKKYSDPDSILKAMESESCIMMRCSWLRDQKSGFKFTKRGEELPESIIGAKEVRKIWDGHKPQSEYIYPDQRILCLPFIALSYFWRSKSHPDPDGVTAAMVSKALKHMWKEYEGANFAEMSMFIDWSSLFQHPRSPEQQKMFDESLKSINLWYAHQMATLYCVTQGNVDDLTYHDKGWTTFEFKVACLIKPSNPTVHRAFPLLIDISADDFGLGERDAEGRAGGGSLKRTPPSELMAFFAGHEHSLKIFTNGADRDKIVAPTFKTTMIEVMGSAEKLVFNGADFDDAEFEQLCLALELCQELKLLELLGMTGTDKSAQSLIKLLNKPDALPKIDFIQINNGPAWKSMTKESREALSNIAKKRKMKTMWLP